MSVITLSIQSLVLANPLPWKQTSLQQETFRGRGKMFVSFIWPCVAQKLNEVILMALSIQKISWYCIGFVCMVYIHYHSKIRTLPEPLLCDTHWKHSVKQISMMFLSVVRYCLRQINEQYICAFCVLVGTFCRLAKVWAEHQTKQCSYQSEAAFSSKQCRLELYNIFVRALCINSSCFKSCPNWYFYFCMACFTEES